mgnify:CR=1 FL=1
MVFVTTTDSGLSQILFCSLVGSKELAELWWKSPNKGFDGKKPEEFTNEEVFKYLNQFFYSSFQFLVI